MAQQETRGLVISEKNLGEHDKLVTIFSENGKFKGVVNGARLPKSKLSAGSQLFSWSHFMYFPGKNLARITEATPIDSFFKISYDLEKLNYASYIANLIDLFYEEGIEDTVMLKLAVYFYYYLAHSDIDPRLLVLLFIIKLLGRNGILPDFSTLKRSLTPNKPVYLHISEGTFSNSFNQGSSGYQYKIEPGESELLLELSRISFEKIKTIETKEDLNRLIDIFNHFIEENTSQMVRAYHTIKTMQEFPALTTKGDLNE